MRRGEDDVAHADDPPRVLRKGTRFLFVFRPSGSGRACRGLKGLKGSVETLQSIPCPYLVKVVVTDLPLLNYLALPHILPSGGPEC